MSKQQGFVLATSFLFLMVISLIGVSSMSSVTLQERMSDNSRELVRARQAANVMLMQAEENIQAWDTIITGDEDASEGVYLYDDSNDANYAYEQNWTDLVTTAPPEGREIPHVVRQPEYMSEFIGFEAYDLSPDSQAKGQGAYIYRNTVRAWGGESNTISVIQANFLKRFQ